MEVNFLLRRAFSILMQWLCRVQIVSVRVNTLDPISDQKNAIFHTRFQTWHTDAEITPSLLRLEFEKSISNSHITLSFLFICN